MRNFSTLIKWITYVVGIGLYSYWFLYELVIEWCLKHPEYAPGFGKPPVGFPACIVDRLENRAAWTVVLIFIFIMSVIFVTKKVRTKTVVLFFVSLYAILFSIEFLLLQSIS